MRAADVLPLVPVMWIAGYWSWGEPSSSTAPPCGRGGAGASRRGCARRARPRAARGSTWASSQARASLSSTRSTTSVQRRIRHRVGLGELDVDRELVGRLDVEVAGDPTGLAHVVDGELERLRQVGAGRTPWRGRPRCASIASRCSSPCGSRRAPRRRRCTRDRRPRPGPPSSSTVGQAARCTEPSCHHDHTSSVTNGRCGANSRSSVDERDRERGAGRLGAVVAERAVRRAASRARGSRRRSPRRTARSARAPARSRSRRTNGSRASTTSCKCRQHRPVERLGRRRAGSSTSSPITPSANFDALRILIASRRPIFIWPSSNAVSTPGRAAHRPVAHRVGAELLEQLHRRDDVALALRHLLAVGIEDPPVDRGVGPRQRVVLEVRADDRGEQPRADDLGRLAGAGPSGTCARTGRGRPPIRTRSAA